MDENNQQNKEDVNSAFKTPNDGAVNSNNQPQNIFEDIQRQQEGSINNAPDPRLTINSVDDSGMPESSENMNAEVPPTTSYSDNSPQPQAMPQEGSPVSTPPTGVSLPQQPQQSSGAYVQTGDLPEEVKKWNWGAFLLSWIWGIGNGVWISLIAIIPAASLIMSIILGIKGGEWAWKTGKFTSIESFVATQKAWTKWGAVVFIAFFVVGLILPLVLALMSFR
ncbi:MAG: hypothetical protein BWY19_00729 [bacterium ADurb.Bin212]|nr:MAG: hypothetical protein BWY19_00729 [bacterium ADurb.Bin212]